MMSRNLKYLAFLMLVSVTAFLHVLPLTASAETGSIVYVDWSPDGTKIATGYYYPEVIRVYSSNSVLLHEFPYAAYGALQGIKWDRTSTMLAYGLSNGTVGVIKVDTGEEKRYQRKTQNMEGLDWSPDSTKLAVGFQDGTFLPMSPHTLEVIEVATMQRIMKIDVLIHGKTDERASINNVLWSPSGEYIATSLTKGTVEIWNAANGANIVELIGKLNPAYGWNFPIDDIDWDPRATRLAAISGEDSGNLMIYDVPSGQLHLDVSIPQVVFARVKWHPVLNIVAIVGAEGYGGDGQSGIWFFNADTGQYTFTPFEIPTDFDWGPNGEIAYDLVGGALAFLQLPEMMVTPTPTPTPTATSTNTPRPFPSPKRG